MIDRDFFCKGRNIFWKSGRGIKLKPSNSDSDTTENPFVWPSCSKEEGKTGGYTYIDAFTNDKEHFLTHLFLHFLKLTAEIMIKSRIPKKPPMIIPRNFIHSFMSPEMKHSA